MISTLWALLCGVALSQLLILMALLVFTLLLLLTEIRSLTIVGMVPVSWSFVGFLSWWCRLCGGLRGTCTRFLGLL
jgi:hypothetical protein